MTNRWGCLVAIVFIFITSVTALAQDEYSKMVENPDLTYEKAEGVLNTMVNKIHELYSDQPEFLEKFDASQEAWENYRLSHIRALYPGGRDNYGSSFDFCGPNESLRLVKERISLIKQWIIGTIEGDVCCGTVRWVPIDEYEKSTGQKIPTTD